MPTCRWCNTNVEKFSQGLKCRDCYNEYMRTYMLRRYHQRRNEAVTFLGSICVDCGAVDNVEFDHVDPKQKEFDICKVWSYSKTRFWQEIMKCVLRCEPCHRIRTSQQQSVPHGGGKTGKRNCYCALCAPLKRKYAKEWKIESKIAGRYPSG